MNTVLSKLSLITHIKEGEDVAEKIAVFLSTSRAGAFVSFRQRGFSLLHPFIDVDVQVGSTTIATADRETLPFGTLLDL